MNGDLSRVTFDKINHYTRVVMQQGRVHLDADFNEQTAILLHYLQALATDIIGPYGGPAADIGFEIAGPAGKLTIGAGRYYVDGRLCELDTEVSFLEQPNFTPSAAPAPGTYLAYLDVWERYVTALEDPSIREVALDGADTAARAKLIWQVKLSPQPTAGVVTCKPFKWVPALNELQGGPRGMLKAKAKFESTPATPPDACLTSPDARFRGVENQLYRVEVHTGGLAGAATFKWSRDNATVVAAFKRLAGDELIVTGMRDATRWFADGDWAELIHDDMELRGEPGTMVQITRVDGESLQIDAGTPGLFNPALVTNPKIRRWNQKETETDPAPPSLRDGTIPIAEATTDHWVELEDGIRIQFQPSAIAGPPAVPHHYRTGDYWLIPARVATGDIEWPDDANGVPPQGIEHHFAPLAFVAIAAGAAAVVTDLRRQFKSGSDCVAP